MTTISAELMRDYTRARSSAAPGEPVTWVRIGHRRTILVSGRDDATSAAVMLNIGTAKTAEEFFRHDPPTGGEIEGAIAAIEDELMRARTVIADNAKLVSTDTVVLAIARMAGVAPASEAILSIDAVEQLYQRFAAITSGAPATSEEIETYSVYAVTILILREFMHHLGYSSIMVTA